MTPTEPAERALFLSISGGGFRATFFHLGVLKYLHDARNSQNQRLLDRAKSIFSVSGGSIVAAHLAVHWSRYKEDFSDAAKSLIRFGQSDVKWRIIRSSTSWLRPPFPPRFTLSLEALYERELFGAVGLDALSVANGPVFVLLGTDLTAGEAFWFSPKGFHVREPESPFTKIKARATFPLARAVAASCALPPYLRPVLIEGEKDMDPSDRSQGRAFALRERWVADGGIYDNIGLGAASEVAREEKLLDAARFIVSDASATFRVQPHLKYRFPVMRPLDVLMNRVARLEQGTVKNVQRVLIDRALGELPTDICAISDEQMRLLVWDGYSKAAASFSSSDPEYRARESDWDPCPVRWWQMGSVRRRQNQLAGDALTKRVHELTTPSKPTNIRGEIWTRFHPVLLWSLTKLRCHPKQVVGLFVVFAVIGVAVVRALQPQMLPTIVSWQTIVPPEIRLSPTDPRDLAFSPNGQYVAMVSREKDINELLVLSQSNPRAATKVASGRNSDRPIFRSDSRYLGFLADFTNGTVLSIRPLTSSREIAAIKTLPAGIRCTEWHQSVFALTATDGIYILRLPDEIDVSQAELSVRPRLIVEGRNLGCPRITDDASAVIFEQSASDIPSVKLATVDGLTNSVLVQGASSPIVIGENLFFEADGLLKSCQLEKCDTGEKAFSIHRTWANERISRFGALFKADMPLPPEDCVYEFVPTRGNTFTKVVCGQGLSQPKLLQPTDLCISTGEGVKRFTRPRGSETWKESEAGCESGTPAVDEPLGPDELCRTTSRSGFEAIAFHDRVEIHEPAGTRVVRLPGAAEPLWDATQRATLYFRTNGAVRYWEPRSGQDGIDLLIPSSNDLMLASVVPGCSTTYDFQSGFFAIIFRQLQTNGVRLSVSQFRLAAKPTRVSSIRAFFKQLGSRWFGAN